jgi:hypothetical protein
MKTLERFRYRLTERPVREVAGKWYFRKLDVIGDTTDSFYQITLNIKKFLRLYCFLIYVVRLFIVIGGYLSGF